MPSSACGPDCSHTRVPECNRDNKYSKMAWKAADILFLVIVKIIYIISQ